MSDMSREDTWVSNVWEGRVSDGFPQPVRTVCRQNSQGTPKQRGASSHPQIKEPFFCLQSARLQSGSTASDQVPMAREHTQQSGGTVQPPGHPDSLPNPLSQIWLALLDLQVRKNNPTWKLHLGQQVAFTRLHQKKKSVSILYRRWLSKT